MSLGHRLADIADDGNLIEIAQASIHFLDNHETRLPIAYNFERRPTARCSPT